MSLTNSPFWMAQTAAGFYDYEINGSLRFDNTGYLTRTNGTPTDEDVWTFSAWVKRSGTASTTGSDTMLGAGQYPGNNNSIRFSNDEGQDELIIFNGGSGQNKGYKRSRSLYRDNGAWYHVCVSRNGGTIAMEVNGISLDIYTQVGFDASVNSQNSSGYTHYVGASERALTPYSGYMAEVNFIDGQALAASYFGETKSGIWIPKQYSGSYGNNGYQLKFNGNANDSSGNGNNFASTNISSHDYVLDSPTNNFATLMIHNYPAGNSNAFSEGNLKFSPGSGDSARNTNRMAISTILPTSGKWYAETYIVDNGGSHFIGVGPKQTVAYNANNTRYAYIYSSDGNSYVNTNGSESISSHGSSYTVGDIIGIYVDMDAATPEVYFSKNGQWANGSGSWNQSSPTSAITLGNSFFTDSVSNQHRKEISFQAVRASGAVSPTTIWNFGQDDTFVGNITSGGNADANGYGSFKYAPPTDALALCSQNLPEPTFSPVDDVTPEDHFNTAIWTGNSTSGRNIVTGHASDIIWIKSRSANTNNYLFDRIRGTNAQLITQATNPSETYSTNRMTAFNSDGFQVGDFSETNGSGNTFVGWSWKAGGTPSSNTDGSITSSVSVNTDAGISLIQYTGNGSNGATFGHGLGVTPDHVIIKRSSSAEAWVNWHRPTFNATEYLRLYTNGAKDSATSLFNSTLPNSSVITLGTGGFTNTSGQTYMCYAFAEKEGFSSFGYYRGNSNSDGTFIYTGFRPAFILWKKYTNGDDWAIHDNRRADYGTMSNPIDDYLRPNGTSSEGDDGPSVDFLSNGFKWRINSGLRNTSGQLYIYWAFAEQPFKYANAR